MAKKDVKKQEEAGIAAEGQKKSPVREDRGFCTSCCGGYQPPQEPELQEPELHPPPPTGLAEVMEKPER